MKISLNYSLIKNGGPRCILSQLGVQNMFENRQTELQHRQCQGLLTQVLSTNMSEPQGA